MGFSLGIVGLPNVGKSTIFNALSKGHVSVSNYPFCTIDPNVAIVNIPDERLQKVVEVIKSAKAVPTHIEFYDIAGLVKNAHTGEGLGNKFLSHIRNVDAIAHVVRCFKDDSVVHVEGQVDPIRDIEIINLELILSDLNSIEKRIESIEKAAKTGDKKLQKELEALKPIKAELDKGNKIYSIKLTQEQKESLSLISLLTNKPVLYIANVDESGNVEQVGKVREIASKEGSGVISICAKLESEIEELDAKEAGEYMQASGIVELGLTRLIKAGYNLLNLITFFTANSKEARAWTITSGTAVPQAAGKVHSDMERGFISADVIHFNDLATCISTHQAKEKGQLHKEGKSYVVADGDLILVHFNV